MTFMDKSSDNIRKKAFAGLSALAFVIWLALFLPAGSFSYWQGWLYWTTFFVCVTAITAYFLKFDLTLIAGRLKAGPTAEKQKTQVIVQTFAAIFFIMLLVIPPFDYRYMWSHVPAALSVAADVFVVLGLIVVFLVFKENSHASATIQVTEGQKVISSGPYSMVRHPMYSGALLMLFFTPLALGSFLGLLAFPPMLLAISFRLVEEEKYLKIKLQGYAEYCKKTRYRLIPFIW